LLPLVLVDDNKPGFPLHTQLVAEQVDADVQESVCVVVPLVQVSDMPFPLPSVQE
jgi:hypothetical protein